MAQQIGLFGATSRVFVDDETGGIAYYPAVFNAEEAAQLFETFERDLPWTQETMWMYDRTVTVPRLIARFLPGDEKPAPLARVQERVESYLGVRFTACSVQLYRGGSDSVAWHSDHTEDLIDLPVIAVLSLGATREMLVRSKGRPRKTFSCDLEPGSLFVMSGRAQEFWEHHIPKAKRAVAPRISVAMRQRRTPLSQPVLSESKDQRRV
jgi:alkylated DNA repair dioxygenase AlkB